MAVKDEPLPPLTEQAADTAYKDDVLETMAEARQRWEAAKAKSEAQVPAWKKDFTTVSGMEVPHLDQGHPGHRPALISGSTGSRGGRSPGRTAGP